MSEICTLLAVGIYIAGRLGPDGVMTGSVALTAIFIAILSQAGFAFGSWIDQKRSRP